MSLPTPDHGTALRRGSLGVAAIVFFVLSAQSPLTGIAGALPIAITLGNGPAAPATFLLVGVVMALFAVGYITMSRHVTDGGAFYTYIGRGLGTTTGTASAFVALFAYCTVQAAMYGLYGATVSGLLAAYAGISVPWWACGLVTMVLVMAWAWLNIEIGARALACLVGLEMGILLVFAVITFARGGGPQGLDFGATFGPSAVASGAPGVAFTFAVASMFGFESTALYAPEARDPRRTIPRATYLAVAVVAVFFAFVAWMVVSFYGSGSVVDAAGQAVGTGEASGLVAGAIQATLGGWAAHAVGIILATSLLAGILAFHNAINRYLHSLAENTVLPRRLAWTNRHGSPYLAGVASTVVAATLVVPFAARGMDPVLTLFSWFGGVSVVGLLVLYVLTSVSVLAWFRRDRRGESTWHTRYSPALAAVLILAGIVLLIVNFGTLTGGSGATAAALLASVAAVFALGLVVALVQRRRSTAAVALAS
ncbi:APC family permease [Amycolatopsis thermoflava]|uniref:Amino acid/polyamine/organocation transporter (APC superfamily) n=1 Tax=Amycolatopsis thermoflava TaxID=84480 RepID=A0A3N2H890_9PSEU|nr:APC family permease [Amycolatopsis thermoflava]ROS45113.1 amino acid/polyamine/organocation transporter (APC superfamily) [Amycolatopsis thermoflava]